MSKTKKKGAQRGPIPEVVKLRARVTSLEIDVEQKAAEIEDMEAQVAAAGAPKIAELQREVAALEAALARATMAAADEATKRVLDALEQTLQHTDDTVNSLTARMGEAATDAAAWRERYEKAEKRVKRLTKDLRGAKDRVVKLDASNEVQRERFANLRKDGVCPMWLAAEARRTVDARGPQQTSAYKRVIRKVMEWALQVEVVTDEDEMEQTASQGETPEPSPDSGIVIAQELPEHDQAQASPPA